MILIDSSVWIDHIRLAEAEMSAALTRGHVLQHPFVTAEIALGSLKDRRGFVAMLAELPQASPVSDSRLLEYVDQAELHGTGIGMIDAHLLACAADGDGMRLWTRDKRLQQHAERLGLAYEPQ